MAKDTQIQFRLDSELKNLALGKKLNMSEIARNAIRAAVHEDETDDENNWPRRLFTAY